VRDIFKRYASGESVADICRDYTARGIPTPQNRGDKPVPWQVSSVCPMLMEVAYIGTFTAQKSTTISYKNHTRISRPPEEHVIIENHHLPIIDMETWDAVQRLRKNRRRYTKLGERSILSGLLFCKDCGATLSYCMQGPDGTKPYFVCKTYRAADCNNIHKCTRHGIKVADIEEIVLSQIKSTVNYARANEREFAEIVYRSQNIDTEKQIKSKTNELGKVEKRVAELDRYITKIYEDNVNGKLSDDRLRKMMSEYENEQSDLVKKAETLRVEIEDLKSKTANLSSFFKLVSEVGEITELTETLARMFIEKVVVHEAVFREGSKRSKISQQVDIHFTYIGQFNPSGESEEFRADSRKGNLILVN